MNASNSNSNSNSLSNTINKVPQSHPGPEDPVIQNSVIVEGKISSISDSADVLGNKSDVAVGSSENIPNNSLSLRSLSAQLVEDNDNEDGENGENGDDDSDDSEIDFDKEQIKKKRASLVAISAAALLSSMVDDDLQQYNYILEWKERHRLKTVKKLSTNGSFFSRITRAFSLNKTVTSSSSQCMSKREKSSRSGSLLQPRLRVLLIEDSLASQKATSLFLRAHGCDVTTVLNGKLGLKCMKTKQFDVCFVDFFTVSLRFIFHPLFF